MPSLTKLQSGLLDQGINSIPQGVGNPGQTTLGGPTISTKNPMNSSTGASILMSGIDRLQTPEQRAAASKELNKLNPYRAGEIRQPGEIPQIQKRKFEDLGIGNPNIQDPRAAMINMAPQDQFRQQQMSVAQKLAAQAQGQGPSIANEQMKQGQESAMAQQFAQMASARGGANPALARQAMQSNAVTESQLAQQAGINRLVEQQQAAGTFGSLAGQARGQDIGLATSQAGMEQQANMAKYQGDLSSAQQLNDLKMRFAAQGLSADQSNQMAALELEKQRNAQSNLENQEKQQSRQGILGTAGQVLSAFTGGGGKKG